MTKQKCPECGKFLLEVKTKKGKMLVCSERECGYRKNTADFEKRRAEAGANKADVKKYMESQEQREKEEKSGLGNTALAAQLAKWMEQNNSDDEK